MSLGGAASVDREAREEGLTGWPAEAVTDALVEAAIDGGPADLMLTHESPAGTPVRAVREHLRKNPHRLTKTALEASAASRAQVSKVWDAVHPELLVHGHMHAPGGGMTEDGRRVASLGKDTQEGSLGLLDMNTLKMVTPSLRQIRDAAERGDEHRVAREKRMKSTAESLHSGVLDGRRPSPDAIRDAQEYIDGRRTLDELIEDVVRRHTRTSEDKP